MKILFLITGIAWLIPTAGSFQDHQEIKIWILENGERQAKATSYFNRVIWQKLAWHRIIIDEPIDWRFKHQKRDWIPGSIRFEKRSGFSINSSASDLSLPLEDYVNILKQDDASPEIEVYTQGGQHWFTLTSKDYAIQADITLIADRLMKGFSGAWVDASETPRLKSQLEATEQEKQALEGERNQLQKRVEELEAENKKLEAQLLPLLPSQADEGIKQLQQLQQNAEVENKREELKTDGQKGEKSVEASPSNRGEADEINQLKADIKGLTQKTTELQTKWDEANQKIRALEKSLSESKQLEEKARTENARLQTEWDALKEKYESAQQEITRLQKNPPKDLGAWLQYHLQNGQDPFSSSGLPLPNSDKRIELVYVPAGQVTMGLSTEEVTALIRETQNAVYEVEEVPPERRMQSIPTGFLIGKYEVTHEEYKALIPEHPYPPELASQPVTNLTEGEIQKFCQLLKAAYPQLDIGLPTEKEWEYVAKSSETRSYTWGNQFDGNKANVGSQNLMEVGQRPESNSWCEASDLIGNASEVCVVDTQTYTHKGNQRLVARGGSYKSDAHDSRTTSRHLLWTPKSDDIGFRIVIRPQQIRAEGGRRSSDRRP